MNQRRIRIAVGLFLVVTLGLMVGAAGYVLYRKGLFEEEVAFTLVAESGQHLSQGMPVVFQGHELGSVQEVDLKRQGHVEARIAIPADQRRWLRTSSTFTVENPLLGNARIRVATPDMDAPLLPKDARVQTRLQDDFNQLIEEAQTVVQDLQRIGAHLREITGEVADPEGDFRQTMVHLERFSGRLADEPALLTLLTDNPATPRHFNEVLARAEAGTGEAEATIAELRQTIARTRTRLLRKGGTVSRVDALLEDLQGKLKVLDPAVHEAAASTQGLEEMRDELRITIEDTRAILRQVEAVLGEDPSTEVPLP
ncbi:MAG: MlaD family protein [Thiohalorhabdus sp.]|uniref:MlaD family protein n=1 Tax=Thiohalorhabdus sp. TaxID=3094134 RepID=UPI0039816E84